MNKNNEKHFQFQFYLYRLIIQLGTKSEILCVLWITAIDVRVSDLGTTLSDRR